MSGHVIIDGNNLLFAMHAHAPIPSVGRETLVRVVERWARKGSDEVTIVFDGPRPGAGLAQQMASPRVDVRYSAPQTADDIIVALIKRAADPGRVRVVSSDNAIRNEARRRRSGCTPSEAFVRELFPPDAKPGQPKKGPAKNAPPPSAGTEEWLRIFGLDKEVDEELRGDVDRFDMPEE